MSLATLEDLEVHLARSLTDEADQAQQALDHASALVESYCNRTFTATVDVVETIYGSGYRVNQALILPVYPVAVAAVEFDGEAFTDYRVVESTGLLYRTDGGVWPSEVEVTYDFGVDPVPDAVKAAVLAVASRLLENPTGATSLRIGEFAETYGEGLSSTEQLILKSIRAPVVA